MDEIELGAEAYLDPKENRGAQIESFFFYGLLSGIVTATIGFMLTIVIAGDILVAIVGASVTFLIGLGASIWNIQAPLNSVPKLFGSYDESWIGPNGIQCYWMRPFGDLSIHVAVGERTVDEFPIEAVETKDGTRFVVWVQIRRWYVKWPLLFVRSIGSGGAPEGAMKKLTEAFVRKYIGLYSDEQIMKVRNMNLLLADILSGETDIVSIPPETEDGVTTETFSFSGNNIEKSIRRQMQLLGIYIPNGGVNVTNINEPDEVAKAKSGERQAEARTRAIETRVKHRAEMKKKYPNVDIGQVEENTLAESGALDLISVRGSAGDFTKGAAVSSSKKRVNNRKTPPPTE